MACHYVKRGTMPIVVGAWYVETMPSIRHCLWYSAYQLIKHNAETCACTIRHHNGYKKFVSVEELSNWHIVEWPAKAR